MSGFRVRVMGDPKLHRWEEDLRKREANNGLGMCRTGGEMRGPCALGGLGCDVDHAWIAYHRRSSV